MYLDLQSSQQHWPLYLNQGYTTHYFGYFGGPGNCPQVSPRPTLDQRSVALRQGRSCQLPFMANHPYGSRHTGIPRHLWGSCSSCFFRTKESAPQKLKKEVLGPSKPEALIHTSCPRRLHLKFSSQVALQILQHLLISNLHFSRHPYIEGGILQRALTPPSSSQVVEDGPQIFHPGSKNFH